MPQAAPLTLAQVRPSRDSFPTSNLTRARAQHLGEMGVVAEPYVHKLQEEGFDTPALFDSLSIEELANVSPHSVLSPRALLNERMHTLAQDFGFKRGHLRAVESWRARADAGKQEP